MKNHRTKAGPKQHARRGATLVEFALVTPVFLLFMFAAIEFAHLNTLRNTANNAAYEAARKVVVPGGTSAEAEREAARILRVVGTTRFTVDVTPDVITDDTQSVTVDIRVPYEQNALMVPWFTGAVTINSKSTLRTERYGGIAAN
jgi:Flp pilus assembly protein TadG